MNLKSDFPIFKNNPTLVYLDSAATSQKPKVVIDAITEYYSNYNSNIHRGIYKLAEKASAKIEEVRYKTYKFINAKLQEEIIFTKSTTEGINLVMNSWGKQNIHKDDVVVATIMDHHSNFVPWQYLANIKKAKFEVIKITKTGELDIADLLLKTKNAKLFVLPHISNMLGTINDVKKIIAKIRKGNKNIKVLVDAAQSVPHTKVDVQDLDTDFLVFSGHKMFSATGVGVLYAKNEILSSMSPFLFGGDMIKEVSIHTTLYADLPNKFEAGTLNIEGIISLGTAIDYINSIGFNKIQDHDNKLIDLTIEKLNTIDGIKIYGPKKRSSLVSFTLDKIHAHDIAQVLADNDICVRAGHHCTMPLHKYLTIPASTRVSFQIYNTEEDVLRVISGIKKVNKLFK